MRLPWQHRASSSPAGPFATLRPQPLANRMTSPPSPEIQPKPRAPPSVFFLAQGWETPQPQVTPDQLHSGARITGLKTELRRNLERPARPTRTRRPSQIPAHRSPDYSGPETACWQ